MILLGHIQWSSDTQGKGVAWIPGYPWLVRIYAGLGEERRDSVEDEGVCPGGQRQSESQGGLPSLICLLPTSNEKSALIS